MPQLNNYLKTCLTCLILLLQVIRISTIRGGEDVNIENVPFLVQIYVQGNFRCAGSLLTNSVAITTATCAAKYQPEQLLVKAGASKLLNTGIISNVSQRLFLTNFTATPQRPYNDMNVALLKLETPFAAETVQTVEFYNKSMQHGDHVQIYGWGNRKGYFNSKNQLQTVELKVIENSKCADMLGPFYDVTDVMFCAAAPGKGTCSDDLGNVVVVNGKLLGMFYYGGSCGGPGNPSVYLNVTSERVQTFIKSSLKKLL